MAKDVRKITGDVLSAVEDGFLSWEAVAKAALGYMSEDDVADMAQINDWALFPDEDEKICPECGEDLGEDGRCYNPDCDQYDPLSQYFDDDEDEDEGHFWALVFMEKGDDVEQVEKYEDFDAVRSDFAYMTQQKPEDFDYVVFQEVTIEDGKENIKIIGEFREGELIESKKTIKEQKLTIDESQSQEIGNAYRKLSKYYGVDLDELVYGPNGFMATKYPDGFSVSADIIYLEDKWDEFEQWMKEKHGIDFEAIREKNHDGNDDDEDDLDESLNSNEARALEAVMTAMKRLDRSADFSEIGERQGGYQFEVRYWGEWIVSNDDISDPDNEDENFEDWDWQELTEEWAKKLNMIVLDVNKKFNVKISWTTGEKNWIDVFVRKSTLEEAVDERTSAEIQGKIDIITKQIPETESRITRYKEEQSKTKNEKGIRILNNRIRKAEKYVRELQKRKEKYEAEFIETKQKEDKEIRDKVEQEIKKVLSPGRGNRRVNKKIELTPKQKEAYKDINNFLKDNLVSIRFDIAEGKEDALKSMIPGLEDNQFKTVSGIGDSGYAKKWGISGTLVAKNVELLPDIIRYSYFKDSNMITEISTIAGILKSDFDALKDKIISYNENGKRNQKEPAKSEPQLTTDRMAAGQWYESLEESTDLTEKKRTLSKGEQIAKAIMRILEEKDLDEAVYVENNVITEMGFNNTDFIFKNDGSVKVDWSNWSKSDFKDMDTTLKWARENSNFKTVEDFLGSDISLVIGVLSSAREEILKVVSEILAETYVIPEEDLEEAAGGLALDMTVEDIAEKHGVDVGDIEKQIKIGVEIEQEHTSDEEQAKKIAMDHLVEFPDYYDRLVKMEKEAEAELDNATDESEALEEALNYDKLNFRGLTGDHELEYEDVPVLNQFDEDMDIDYTLDINISQEMVINFICEYYILARDILTMEEAQMFIDKAAKEDREAFEEYLLDLFYEEAEEAAQEYLFTDYVEGYGPNKYKVKITEEDEDEEEIANLTEAITTKQEIDGIVVDINEYDLDLRDDKITAYMNMWISDDQEVWLRFEYNDVLENAEFDWEADGQPTYVPQGEQSVLYDDGKGGVESVDVGELEPDEEFYETLDETVLSREEVLNILKIDEEQLTKLEKAARKIASKYLKPIIEEELKDDSDFWPDEDDYDPRDDYDPFN